ncbi:hypothetical protein FOZ61_002831 [Perkinsus olseni]|uniref:Aluminum-activated malate transporter 1 n=1 Tax=Perkinsus olseni TaxID=32597 RepID=A0A7J6LRP3_PEROL|nr:hypothetical protein FOZ61_002831 [Perkinsus olseni]KAF4672297.1 hypothetical protein FOL46_009205 [Perkinsus olseni]
MSYHHPWYEYYLAIAPIWAVFAVQLSYEPCRRFSLKVICGAWLGYGLGALVHTIIAALLPANEYHRLWSIVLNIPFTLFICMGHRASPCKLRELWLAEAALIMNCSPVAFYVFHPYLDGLVFTTASTYGAVVAMVIMRILSAFNALPRGGPSRLETFAATVAEVYDVFCTFFTSANKHPALIDQTYAQLVEQCREMSALPIPPELKNTMWRMIGFLISIKEAISGGPFDDTLIDLLWRPLAVDILDLRSEAAVMLRGSFDNNTPATVENDNVGDLSRKCFEKVLKNQLACEELLGSSFSDYDELMRFRFGIGNMLYFASEVQAFHDALTKLRSQWRKKERLPIMELLFGPIYELADFLNDWWKKPFFIGLEEDPSIWHKMKFSVRYTLSITVGSLLLRAGALYLPLLKARSLWCILGVQVASLPTAGATLVRGTHRFIGTVLGCMIGMLCLWVNAHSVSSMVVEMLIISFFCKLIQLSSEAIGYASLVTFLTWTVVCMGLSFTMYDDELEDMLIASAWRSALTLGGVIFGSIFSCVVVPSYASYRLRLSSAFAIENSTREVEKAVAQLIDVYTRPEGEVEDNRAEFSALSFKLLGERLSLLNDSRAEVLVYGPVGITPRLVESMIHSEVEISKMNRCAIILHNALVKTALSPKDREDGLLSKVLPPLKEMEAALTLARMRVVDEIRNDTRSRHITFNEDVNVAVQKCFDAFFAARKADLDEAKDWSEPLSEKLDSGGARAFFLMYALKLFSEQWTVLETRLFGCHVPVEMIPRSTSPSISHPRSRALSHSASQG